jgi:hypothetical protein
MEVPDIGDTIGSEGFWGPGGHGRVPEGHFLKKIDGQIDWRPFHSLIAIKKAA